MTTRLKKKLGDLGVDLNSRKANENFCLIGTPLPPLEKSKDTGEFVPLWKQEVRDEKGRRRLHGAFTGGFSAGYFNSVGSKEGWAPSTFVSSRSDRAKKPAARPEDFMDEEDLQELKERMLVSTTEDAPTPVVPIQTGDMGLDNDPIAAALQTSAQGKDTAGTKILKKMGWRPGHGLGPRVSLKERKRQDAQAFNPYTGIKSTGNSLDVASDDEEANKHTYPRRDTPILNVSNQNKRFGLGYKPGLSLNETLGVDGQPKLSGPNISAGFGLGASNEADDDDIDIYDTDAIFQNKDCDDTIVIGAKGKGRESRPTAQVKVSGQTFFNGKAVLSGFTLSDKPVQEDKWYPGPEVPADWKPNPRKVWDASDRGNKENVQVTPAPLGGRDRNKVSATERGAILGEAPAVTGPRSVFDFMSEKDRERIKRIASNAGNKGPVAGEDKAPEAPGPSLPYTVPRIEPEIAQAALKGFQPFTKDLAKQARYNTFVQSQAYPDAPPLRQMPGQGLDEFHKELEDYAKSAVLFKPMTGAMAGRFTSAAVLDLGPKVVEGLHQPTQQEYAQKEEEAKKEEEEKVTPKMHAARMGMYGPMTRETTPWMPAKLLCKRFGVKEPEPPAGEDPVGASSKTGFTPTEFEKEAKEAASSAFEPGTLENIGLGDDETQGADILTYERPSMDIFKAIFASDDEDSDGEDDQKEGDEEDNDGEAGTGQLKSLTQELKLQDTGPVDPTTFKPMFIPREGKAKATHKVGDEGRSKEKKEKKEKKKKDKKSVLVSFAMDEDGEDLGLGKPQKDKDRPKKKRKEKEGKKDGEEEDAGMYIDPPEHHLLGKQSGKAPVAYAAEAPREDATPAASQRVRKRAIDFLD
ncbi:DUF1604 domain-containing protein [Ephemerocybe angulata]|uniref:DUF1604 domain-containing protein n=1 Tax=Ephemerocybe angulata TaxID=980116 RepID=A0A8H6IAY8_9AGAR|nr:DUF1604 domain-containing protein [Tulosesus angulatus]